ncbi:MAG: peptide chain release factor 1 [Bradymonadia bacterium]|jgi:peptide chain release factor 1
MFEGLRDVVGRYEELEHKLSDPEIAGDHLKYTKVHREMASMEKLVFAYREYTDTLDQVAENKEMLGDSDDEIKELAKMELKELEPRVSEIEQHLKVLMLPTDPMDEKNIILEVRAGAGGDESSLFSGDLMEMYTRFAQNRGWKVEMMSSSQGSVGGFKEAIAKIVGDSVYSTLKWESGVHRVQRVPSTESQGRIHTSTATVAVLPEAEDLDFVVDPQDIRTDVFRASGSGGQHVNRTESAVRLTHLPTGVVVSCQDEKSQHKNKSKAMVVMKSRLYALERARIDGERADDRRSQVGTGDRSERIRTYNFPQNRITDHRIGLSVYKLDKFIMGELEEVLDALTADNQAKLLQAEEGY